jgi:hypothetical protein
MAIKFVDQAPEAPRKPVRDKAAQAEGEARFATPIEATTPVNPDAASQLPFSDLPAGEKKKRRRKS